ncbi:MAG TPA: carboxypeptidase-like regulatory domain-containing protein [Pyrinomonadaceae bacterium]|jgi:hypothetical protein|nr:carboxypeptidase-like regulatory domain-containing protein [Pyrinomonadaceae bacterium]
MNRHLRESAPPLLAFALMLACAVGWALGPRGASAEAAGRGQESSEAGPEVAVYGRAVYEGSGRPVRRARLMLLSPDRQGRAREATTDARGEFRFRGVGPGRYFVAVDQPGLLSPVSFVDFGGARDRGAFDTSEVAKYFDIFEVDGKADKEVTARARRGAALAGRVSYADGEPAAGITLHILRRADGRLTRVVTGMSRGALSLGVRTDDRGFYRASGLPPGEYLLAVSEAAEHGEPQTRDTYLDVDYTEDAAINHLLMTYHPSASRPRDAEAVKVEPGDEREDVNIVIPDRELRTLTGVVRTRRGARPVANAAVVIARRDDELGPAAGAAFYSAQSRDGVRTDAQGRWQLRDIPDGAYTLFVTPPTEYERSEGSPTMNGSFYSTNANVTLSNANSFINRNHNSGRYVEPRPKKLYAPARLDLQVGAAGTELEIELADSGRISGAISYESPKDAGRGGYVYAVRMMKATGAATAESIYPAQLEDGGFVIEGLAPGEYFIRHGVYDDNASRLQLKAVTWGGRDFTREPLVVGEGQEVEGVRVVLSSEVASLRVRVAGADKRPAPRSYVFLVSPDASKWAPYAPQSYCVTDGEGSCEVGAAPGEYAVLALRLGRRGVGEEEMKSLVASAPRVSLRLGEPKTLDLTLTTVR